MEGQTKLTNKLRFIESKKKLKINNQITQPHQKLITAANNHDLTLIGCEDNTIKCVQTSQLLDFTSNQVQVINENPTNLISLTFRPTLLSVARYGFSSVLLIAGASSFPNCPNLEVYDLDSRTTIGKISLNELEGAEIVDYAWHPNYYESIVVLCSNRGHLLVLAINRQDKGIGIVYKNEQYGALTCCWSPKGKNLAVGTMSGRIFRLEPQVSDNKFSFKEVDRSTLTFTNPKLTPEHQVARLRWINKNYLMAVHAKINTPSAPDTVYSLITVKPSKPYLYWTNISFENQARSNYVVHLANLTNSVICASNASGEAGAIGVLGASQATTNEMNDWDALIIEEEGARIELPLDTNNRDTHPCGVTVTVWTQDNMPILIFYTNDGLICPYAAMHSENILKLPEFQPPQTFKFDVRQQQQPQQQQQQGGAAHTPITSFYKAPLFGGSPSFGGAPAFGGSPSFSGAPAFGGSPSFSGAPAFGSSPSFSGAPAFGSSPSVNGAPTSGASLSFSAAPAHSTPTAVKAAPAHSGPPTSSAALALGTPFSSSAAPALGTTFSSSAALASNAPSSFSAAPALGAPIAVKAVPSHGGPLSSSPKILPKLDEQSGIIIGTNLTKEINEVKEKLNLNEAYMSLFEELNQLRDRLDDILDLHKVHNEAVDAVKTDIDKVDLDVIETFYLIEYIKSRKSCDVKKKSIDPNTLKKVNNIKLKLRSVEETLEELNNHVDVAWEDFMRRKSNKERRISSLDIIYKSLATNQKIINTLRRKVDLTPSRLAVSVAANSGGMPNVKPRDEDHSKFREFLASRSVVPVRKPIH